METRLFSETQKDTLAELVVETLSKELKGKNLVRLNGYQKTPIVRVSYDAGKNLIIEARSEHGTIYVSDKNLDKYRIID